MARLTLSLLTRPPWRDRDQDSVIADVKMPKDGAKKDDDDGGAD